MLTAGDNPRITIKLAIFNAGGVVRPRPASLHDPHHPATRITPRPSTGHAPATDAFQSRLSLLCRVCSGSSSCIQRRIRRVRRGR